jgi:broad specificity phosphatase PhoE
VETVGDTSYTREKPWHGRSGGGLVDVEARCLVGVVQGYEVWPTQRGLYVSHAAILRFLNAHWQGAPRPPPTPPLPVPRQPLKLPVPCPGPFD